MKIPAKETQKRILFGSLSVMFLILIGFVFFRYLFFAFLPFLLAFAAASLLQKPASKISKRFKLSYRAIAIALTVLCVSFFLSLLGLFVWQTASEIGAFAAATLRGENGFLESLSSAMTHASDIISRLPFFAGENASALREKAIETISDMVKNFLLSAASNIPAFAAKFVSAIPEIFIFFVVTVLSAVYFCMDYEKIIRWLKETLSKTQFSALRALVSVIGETAGKFIKSYFLLFLFTFAELFLGFVLLSEPYAFLLALLTAVVDSLPIFGTGTVLFPLALYHFITGNSAYGIGVCILYLVVTLVRQILEPRILGAGVGVHPLVMLIAMYFGFHFFGISGLLFAPFLTVIAKNLIGIRRKTLEKTH